MPVARSPQEFVVELMRYEGTEPWMTFAMPVLGAPLTNIAAHLAGPNRDVLPLQTLGYPLFKVCTNAVGLWSALG
jgi:hypothetical protein